MKVARELGWESGKEAERRAGRRLPAPEQGVTERQSCVQGNECWSLVPWSLGLQQSGDFNQLP